MIIKNSEIKIKGIGGGVKLLRQYLKSKIAEVRSDNIQVVYNLFFNNTHYSIECYREGFHQKDSLNYSLVEDFTDDEGEAEDFLYRLVKGKVLPVHMKELIEDHFNN